MAGEANDIVAPRGRLVRGALTGWAVLIYFFLFAPIILLVLFSFNSNQYGTLPITGWTTHWYQEAFNDFQIQDAVKTTLSVALEVTAAQHVRRDRGGVPAGPLEPPVPQWDPRRADAADHASRDC